VQKIPIGKGCFTLVSDEDFDLVNRFTWHKTDHGYVRGRVGNSLVLLHCLILKKKNKKLKIDHIDGDRLNNTRENLRVVTSSTNNFFLEGNILEIVYVAGYAALPAPIKSVELSILEERYNKKKSGISLNFGSDVQRVSIAGTISVDFDYSLQSNERVSAYGTILGNYINVLDQYRSERVLTGSGMITYVS